MTYFSKLGPHIQTDSGGARQWVTNSTTVKVVDADAASIFGSTPAGSLLIFRHYLGEGDAQYQGKSGKAVADEVIGALGWGPAPNLYIEGPNECGLDDIENFTAFMRDFTNEAHSRGYKVAGFSFSVGNPQPDQVSYFRSQGWAGVDTIACHAYWDNNGPTYQWTALRHRTWWQSGDPPVIITECGRLCIGSYQGSNPTNCSGYANGGGWEDFYQTNCQPYADELGQFDGAIATDNYVLGAHIFTTGGPGFSSFEIDDVLPCLAGGTTTNPPPNPTGSGACIADPDCIAINGNGWYCQGAGTANSSCQPCPTSTPAGYVLAQTMDYTPQLIGVGIVAAGIAGIAALVKGGK